MLLFNKDLIFYLNENNKQAKENHHYINQDSVPVYSSMSDKGAAVNDSMIISAYMHMHK